MTVQPASSIFRRYVIPGVPASGPNQVSKDDAVAWGTWLETILNAASASIAKPSLSALNADLAHADSSTAIVYADATAANNGLYVKSGASGSGSWLRAGDLQVSLIRMTVTGGTANAIVATVPVAPVVPGNFLYLLTPTANSSAGAVTVNGTPIKDYFGNDPAANALMNGTPVLMAYSVDHYQLMLPSQVDASGILAAALAAQTGAQGYATAAASSASALGNQVHQYDTLALAQAATIPVGVQAIKVTRFDASSPASYATYVPGTSSGPEAFQEAGGHWWQLDLTVSPINCFWFKRSTDAGDAGLMLNRFFAAVTGSVAADGVIPPGNYQITTQVSIIGPLSWRSRVSAAGARFTTVGAISAFYVEGSGYSGGIDFIDFTINHQANATVTYGWVMKQAGNMQLINPVIVCGGTSSTYAAVYITQKVPSDSSTGSFWNLIFNPQIYSTTVATFQYGVLLEGASNHTRIKGGLMSTGVYGVFLQYLAASSSAPNAVLVDDVAFEVVTTCVNNSGVAGTVNAAPYGLRITNCRAESASIFLGHTGGINVNTSSPTVLRGNTLIGVTNYINNPGGLRIRAEDYPMDLSGRATITASTSVGVSFQVSQPSANYIVSLTPSANVVCWVTTKTVTGFTINISSSSTVNVDWTIVRESL